MHELLNSAKHLEHRGEWKAKTGEIQRSIKMQINRTGKGQESTTLTQMPACVHNSGVKQRLCPQSGTLRPRLPETPAPAYCGLDQPAHTCTGDRRNRLCVRICNSPRNL